MSKSSLVNKVTNKAVPVKTVINELIAKLLSTKKETTDIANPINRIITIR